jgi:predicted RNA-binding protein with PUA-like domain
MNYWLVISEPKQYSWQEFVRDGRAMWDGVRNYQARNYLKRMRLGDRVFFYHSVNNPGIVGIAGVIKEFYPDPTSKDPQWVAVDLKPIQALKTSISLAQIRSNKALQKMFLLRQSRLSVMPVTSQEYHRLLKLL